MTKRIKPRTEVFLGASGNKLVSDVYGDGPRAAILLHGGGQTRHAFAEAAQRIGAAGWTALTFDQRGHGDSEWASDGAYNFFNFGEDAAAIAATLTQRFGSPPVVIGASLGGGAALVAEGEAA